MPSQIKGLQTYIGGEVIQKLYEFIYTVVGINRLAEPEAGKVGNIYGEMLAQFVYAL